MNVVKEKAQGIVGYNICDIRPVEMKYMCVVCDKVKSILDNHKDPKAKKEYLGDDDLEKIWAILSVLTRDSELSSRPTEFELFLKVQNAPATQPVNNPDSVNTGENEND